MRLLTLIIVTIALSACTTIPEQIQGTYTEISPARVEPGVFGSSVRWGGVILSAKNQNNKTCFEILSRELDKYLRPKLQDSTMGRFIACSKGFHDPLVFSNGREITVTGKITNIDVRKVDDFDYRYPSVEVNDLVLWQKRRVVMRYRGYNDSFYGPWGRSHYWGGYGGWGGYRGYGGWGGYGPGYSTGYAEPMVLRPDPAIVETRE
jgi:outer membrane lipoprotein